MVVASDPTVVAADVVDTPGADVVDGRGSTVVPSTDPNVVAIVVGATVVDGASVTAASDCSKHATTDICRL